MIYDRGFASQLIPFLHLHFGSNCLIRIPLERTNTVISFLNSGKKQIKAINKRRLLNYQPNRNVSAGLLKRYIIRFMLGNNRDLKSYILDYQFQIIQTLEALRPNKNKVRKRRLMRGAERHSHEKNYRRAF